MSDFTVRFRKFLKNPVLNRRQMILDVFHPNKANVSKAALQAHLVKLFKVNDAHCVVLFGFRTAFGGGKSTGFALVYNTLDDALDIEPKYRLQRAELMGKSVGSRKQRREMKNKRLKARGIAKAKIGGGKKKR